MNLCRIDNRIFSKDKKAKFMSSVVFDWLSYRQGHDNQEVQIAMDNMNELGTTVILTD